MKLSDNQQALLAFVREAYAQTQEPVTDLQIRLARRIRNRCVTSTHAALVRKGLLLVPEIGVAAWVPATIRP